MLSEYNEALHIATEKKISYQEGYNEGIEHEKKITESERHNAAKALIGFCRDMGLNRNDTLEKLLSVLKLDTAHAQKIVEQYWPEEYLK